MFGITLHELFLQKNILFNTRKKIEDKRILKDYVHKLSNWSKKMWKENDSLDFFSFVSVMTIHTRITIIYKK